MRAKRPAAGISLYQALRIAEDRLAGSQGPDGRPAMEHVVDALENMFATHADASALQYCKTVRRASRFMARSRG